jgi:hypothetical protein
VGHYKEGSQFHVAAFHRRALKGTDGTLEICEESIQFVSAKPADSRTWACWAARIGKLTS